ncbi:hypothetical protein LTR66_010890 [Elasticomyces elasticus]|nr:hypothetical protein LTR66_010890 [Elasticomyces elasticus]
MSTCSGFFAIRDRFVETAVDEESRALLGDARDGSPSKTATDYATIPEGDDSDEDESDRNKGVKEKQRQRLEQHGNWIGYLRDFKILLPLVWPHHNRKVQACLAVIGATMIADRFFTVLVPRQLGIITDKLTMVAGKGIMPYHEIAVWLLYSWLVSPAGYNILKNFAELPMQQYSYQSIAGIAFDHIMNLSMDFHTDKNSGELIRAIDQGQGLHDLLDFVCFSLGPMVIDLVVAFGYVYYLFDVYMMLIILVTGLVYTWVATKFTQISRGRQRNWVKQWRTESRVQTESISNWQTISYFNNARYESQRYGTAVTAVNTAQRSYFSIYYFGSGLQSAVLLLGRLSVSLLAMRRISQGTASIGSFITLNAYWTAIQSPILNAAGSFRRISTLLIDSERLLQLLRTTASVKDAPNASPLCVSVGKIEFEDVCFAYDDRKPTLKNLTFTAEPEKTVALVGETGGGKSTTLKVLFRFYDVKSGSIKIDEQDIRSVTLESLRNVFGCVPQDPSLFNISILENVRYARLDATDEEVHDACRAASMHDKILSFPDGYESKVGERGVKLSGGELQRVAIARAILRKPKFVLLDEATSMVDTETEAQIQEAFERLTSGRTTFVVAHRLSTIQHADLILVINDGEIVERGTHDELLALNGKYVRLWSKQSGKTRTADTNRSVNVSTDSTLIETDDEIASACKSDHDGDFGVPRLDGDFDGLR